MPDAPLEQPLEIIIEPKKVAMTDFWVIGIKDDGALWMWGAGSGNLATGAYDPPTPKQIEGIDVQEIHKSLFTTH
ncbi:hypothetical protein [Moraxella equi]|uniref:Regulator of chromosome condensation (RCC1) repeat n=1 Tax=Moraxella equi TaxID=60442 RepID=A0A378QSS4_9GAMM|nr:hypothetical protein [Moraxella equi]OPH40116.1 hypothetical protein B5J93_00875 [Moraxella equi]STZ03915.1 Uncharacterised protein [Moraxella equi]